MNELEEYRVSDMMTYRPVAVSPSTALGEIEALFAKHDYALLPVRDVDGALVGAVTKMDVLRAFALEPGEAAGRFEKVLRLPARAIMTAKPATVAPNASLTTVLALMNATSRPSFPVTIGSLLIGVITRRDVLRAVQRVAARDRTPDDDRPAPEARDLRCAVDE